MTRQGEGSGPAGRCSRGASSIERGVGARKGRMPLDPEDKALGRLKRALRKAERHAGDGSDIGGTGATILKFLPAPLARLVDKKRIGPEEVHAADEIAIAFHAQAGALMIRDAGIMQVIATADRDSPAAIRWIERLGFVRSCVQPIDDKMLFEWNREDAAAATETSADPRM
jgi:hypothetical protein